MRFAIAAFLSLFLIAMPKPGQAADYFYPILDPSENQASEGVRRYDATSVLMACSYTASGSETQGMLWLGSLETGVGTTYKVAPQFAGQTVTTSLYYGPNTAYVNPSLGAGNIQIVGSYKYEEAALPDANNGLIYTGSLDGTSGTWAAINVPSGLTSDTVANTIPHSVMGQLVVGNYDLDGDPLSGNAFLYNLATDTYTIFDIGGVANLTTAYGIWQNSADSYTIVGGSQHLGLNQAYIVDYTLSTGTFGTPTYFLPRGEGVDIFSHFEGISGLGDGRYSLIGMTVDTNGDPAGVDYVEVTRQGNGSFSRGDWVPLALPGATFMTGNTVIDNKVLGIYRTSLSPNVGTYVATVPEPGSTALVIAALGVFMAASRRRRKPRTV